MYIIFYYINLLYTYIIRRYIHKYIFYIFQSICFLGSPNLKTDFPFLEAYQGQAWQRLLGHFGFGMQERNTPYTVTNIYESNTIKKKNNTHDDEDDDDDDDDDLYCNKPAT